MSRENPPPQTIKLPKRESDEVLVDDLLEQREREGRIPAPGSLEMWDHVIRLVSDIGKEPRT